VQPLRKDFEKAVETIETTGKLQQILEYVNDRGFTSVKEVAIVFKTSRPTASKQLKDLQKRKLIKKVGYGKYAKLV